MEQRSTRSSSKAKAKAEEFSRPGWHRLPDTVLRQLFKKLDFADIKSCRLVCIQWHRHALHNVNFILSADRLGPTATCSVIIRRPEDLNKCRCSSVFKLVPYSTTANADEIISRIVATLPPLLLHADEPHQKANFRQLPVVFSNFLQKIKRVVFRCGRDPALPILLRALVPSFPAAERILLAKQWPFRDIWAEFETSSKATPTTDATAKADRPTCVVNSIAEEDVEDPANSVVLQMVFEDADSIQVLTADGCGCIVEALAAFANNNDQRPLIFNGCKELNIRPYFDDDDEQTDAPIDVSRHCPALEHLQCSTANLASSFDNLERLGNLKSLAIYAGWSDWMMQPRPQLRFENLTKLQLGHDVYLPENPREFVSAGLKMLELVSYDENLECLAAHAQNGGRNLRKLEQLQLIDSLEQISIDQYLRQILTAASKLRTLTIEVEDILSIAIVCDIAAEASTSLTAMDLGHLQIPELWNCRAFLRSLVDRIKQKNLKAAVAISFDDDVVGGLANALSKADFCCDDVAVSKARDDAVDEYSESFELTWHNNAAGIQQKLQIQVYESMW